MGFRGLTRAGDGAGGAAGVGDIEGVTAGSGLTGGGTSGTVALAVDHATVAPLISGTAAVGVSTKSARQDHVHPQDVGDIEGVTAGSGLTGGGTSGTVALAVDHATVAPLIPGTAAVGVSTKSARQDHAHPQGVSNVGDWFTTNMAASQTNLVLTRLGVANVHRHWRAPRAGVIVALSMCVSNGSSGPANVTGSALSVGIGSGSLGTTFSASLLSVAVGANGGQADIGSPIAFAAGEYVSITATTDVNWTGTGLELNGDILVRFD